MTVMAEVNKWLEEREARERAEQQAYDFSVATQTWVKRAKEYKEQRDVWAMVAFVMFGLVLVLSCVLWPH